VDLDAEFRDTLGAQVTASGAPLNTYAVYRRKDGLRAVVFANMSDKESVDCEASLEDVKSAVLKLVSPEDPEPKPWPGKLRLAPGSAAVILES
jgi:hypothetical protein